MRSRRLAGFTEEMKGWVEIKDRSIQEFLVKKLSVFKNNAVSINDLINQFLKKIFYHFFRSGLNNVASEIISCNLNYRDGDYLKWEPIYFFCCLEKMLSSAYRIMNSWTLEGFLLDFLINNALGNNFISLTNAFAHRDLKSFFNLWLCLKGIKPVLQQIFTDSTFVLSNQLRSAPPKLKINLLGKKSDTCPFVLPFFYCRLPLINFSLNTYLLT